MKNQLSKSNDQENQSSMSYFEKRTFFFTCLQMTYMPANDIYNLEMFYILGINFWTTVFTSQVSCAVVDTITIYQ